MAATELAGPVFVAGNLTNMAVTGGVGSPDSTNPDAGPSGEYQGDGILDPRFFFPKDKITGYTGVVASHFNVPALCGVTAIPAALSAVNIASVAGTTSGTALALATPSVGVATNIPIRPFSGSVNGAAPITVAIALDFGFEFANCTAGNPVVAVASGADFTLGMPLCIANVGNAGGTAALLTTVIGISGNNITLLNAPLATNAAAPVGTGDLWGPSVVGYALPQSALPWLGAGPGLWLDPRQALARGVRVVGAVGGTGGTFTVKGYDVYHQPMSETITVGAGAVTGWGKKAFKYIASVTPNFTDAHAYTVGTSDVFGLNYRGTFFDQLDVFWASTFMNTSTGYTGPDNTSPATSTTGDVRGTIQTSANGGGTGIGATASNGTVSGLAMTGNRFTASLFPLVNQAVATTQANPTPLFGQTQA